MAEYMKIMWIESYGASVVNREYRDTVRKSLQSFATIDLLCDFDSVREELKIEKHKERLWVVEEGFPTRMSGLVDRIKEEHPKDKIVLYNAGTLYRGSNIDYQFDISTQRPEEVADVLRGYRN